MEQTISIDYPRYLADSLRMSKSDFGKEIKTASLVKLFEMGNISSGMAAKVLSISRVEFLELLSKYKISYLDTGDTSKDFENA